MLRVAHVIAGLSIGGAERQLVNVLNATSCDYRGVFFIDEPRAGPSFHQQLHADVEQCFIRIRRRNMAFGVMKLASLLRRRRVNVVHTHMFDANLYGALAARLSKVPVVVTSEHGENPWKLAIHRWLERQVISPLTDARLCVSQNILELRRDVDGVPASKLMIMDNGTVLPALEARQSTNPEPLIGTVGRFVPAKNYPSLLQAVASLRRRGRLLRLCIVGDGPEMPSIRRLVDELGLSDVVSLPGLVTDIAQWYQRFDIYVSSSIREGQPVTILEAMSFGLPVVATDVGASASTVMHGTGGLIVPPGDPEPLTDALCSLLDSPELRTTLGVNARARVVTRFSIQTTAAAQLKLYNDILEKKKLQ